MSILSELNRRTSIKTKGILYMMLMIILIYLSVSLIVLSTARKNLDLQLRQFHLSIAEKLADTASDALVSMDYGSLLEQVKQFKKTSQVKGAKVVDRRGTIVMSDDLGEIGRHDRDLFELVRKIGPAGQSAAGSGSPVLLPVSVGGDVLGALQVDFNKKASPDKEFGKTKIELAYLSFLIFAAGIGGSFIVSSILTRPVTRIVREVETFEKEMKITSGADSLHDPVVRDEAVHLGQAFQHMIENLKKYLKEFEKMSGEREKLACMATVGQMSAQIAHEMRNSLYAIRGAATEIGKVNRQPEIKEYTDIIKDECVEMMIMADEFLRFSRVPSPSLRPCHVSEVVGKTAELLEADLEDAGVTIKRIAGPAMPQIMCDPALLKQVFMNLFINAIQAMKGGGIITVKYELAGEWLKVHVMDTGPGIPDKIAPSIFQPFFTTRHEGSGLGLATVYKIMLTHHGEIRLARSEKGAHFELLFPMPGNTSEQAQNMKTDWEKKLQWKEF